MTKSTLPDAPYLRIVAAIRARIASGELREGDRIPSARQIVQEWGVAIATATKVLAALQQEGLVRALPGVGTVVSATEAPPAGRATRRKAQVPHAELTTDRIVRAAMEVARLEGLGALSMRRIASELGVATMSLYRHVPSKEELVALMSDAVFDELKFPEPPPPGWRARLEAAARLQWALHRRHPWLARSLSVTRPHATPKTLAYSEWVMRALDGMGLTPNTMLHAHITLFSYVRGLAVSFEWEAEAEADTGLTSDQWMNARHEAVESLLGGGAFPTFAGVLRDLDVEFDLDSLFEFGLARLLDGFALLSREMSS